MKEKVRKRVFYGRYMEWKVGKEAEEKEQGEGYGSGRVNIVNGN